MSLVNVTVFVPDSSVKSMADEVADGSVSKAVEAAKKAFLSADNDGSVDVKYYTEDFDNAVTEALSVADGTNGRDLLVIVTDLLGNDLPGAERLLTGLTTDNFVVIVPVSNQGYDEGWATKLDDSLPTRHLIDVISVEGLADPATAFAEVRRWLNAA